MELSILALILGILGSFLSSFVTYFSKKSLNISKRKYWLQNGEFDNNSLSDNKDNIVETGEEYEPFKGKQVLFQKIRGYKEMPKPSINNLQRKSGRTVLLVFLFIVLLLGVFTLIRYWNNIINDIEALLYFMWLFLTMIAGMFVQVVTSNYRNGNELLDVSMSQLVYPILFSLIVFYPVWSIGAASTQSLFSFYAAFLNGFFWETVVSSTKLSSANK